MHVTTTRVQHRTHCNFTRHGTNTLWNRDNGHDTAYLRSVKINMYDTESLYSLVSDEMCAAISPFWVSNNYHEGNPETVSLNVSLSGPSKRGVIFVARNLVASKSLITIKGEAITPKRSLSELPRLVTFTDVRVIIAKSIATNAGVNGAKSLSSL